MRQKNIKHNTTMKKRHLILFFASLMAHYGVQAQTICPMLQDGKVWTYEATNFIYDWEETYSLEGDTVIGSRNCLKLYFTCLFYSQDHLYKGAMYEKGGQVYIIAPSSTTPALLYDFSSKPGTTIKVGEYEIKIEEKKLVKYRGEYLRVVDYSVTEDEYDDFEVFKGVEGIGYLVGGLTSILDGYVPGNTGGARYLKMCTMSGEVIFDSDDFNASSETVTPPADPVAFTEGQMATIVLPMAPEASRGKYYRLDRVEGNEIVFEQEMQPKAHIPYIIVPGEDFYIEHGTLDLNGLSRDTVSIDGVSFIGTYQKEEIESKEGFYIDIIDATPDCILSDNKLKVGALRAFLQVHWDDPYSHGGTKAPAEKMQIVLHDHGTGLKTLSNSPLKGKNIYDLSGRRLSNGKLPHDIYIEDGRKKLK